jgi:hypothetical protein
MKQFELGEYVTDDLYGDEPYPVVGVITNLISRPYEVEAVTVYAPYVGSIELRIEDIRYANSEPLKRPSRVPVTQVIRIFDYFFVYVMGAGVIQGMAI